MKLKPCPFCAKEDELTVMANEYIEGMHFVICDSCGAVTSFRNNESRQQTISQWNGRNEQTMH